MIFGPRLCHGAVFGSGTAPEPSAPVFASEPGALAAITEPNEVTLLGFVAATGYPAPEHTLTGTGVPEGAKIFIGADEVDLPAVVPPNMAHLIPLTGALATGPLDESFELIYTASNGVAPDATASAIVSIDVPHPNPAWNTSSLSVELPITDPLDLGALIAVINATLITVQSVPNKGIYYLVGGDPLGASDTFDPDDMPILRAASDGDTGSVTGALVLRATGLGDGHAGIAITVTIAEAAAPVITEREFEIEEGTEAPIAFGLSNYKPGAPITITNNSTTPLVYEDKSV